MSHVVVKSHSQYNLDCYQMSAPIWQVSRILGHDPRSKHWKVLEPWLRDIYESKQRATSTPRITALKEYIINRLMAKDKFGALPPISIIQFEPLVDDQLVKVGDSLKIEEGKAEVNRVLIDGLARYTAAIEIREQLKTENPDRVKDLDEAFEFSIALYVPQCVSIDASVAGQLFTDFNSYAWLVPSAKTLAEDMYNPYKLCALNVNHPGGIIRKYGGLKSGSSNLGAKDTAFATEMMLAQFCKIAIEGQKGFGKLNKPVSNPKIAKLIPEEEGAKIAHFFQALETAIGSARFGDRTQLFRTGHGLYALAVIANDAIYEGRTSLKEAVEGLAAIDWTWSNQDFRKNIGRVSAKGEWRLNTGAGSIAYLVSYCRPRCKIHLSVAA
jgi:DNA-sulfur modification-associated